MNLHSIVAPYISAVNPMIPAAVEVSIGSTANPDGTRTPAFADPVMVLAQVQPLQFRDITMIDGLNLQGTRKAIYLNGHVDGLIRPVNQGGDLITLSDGSVWLTAVVAEGWDTTAGWCKVICTLQNDFPAYAQS